MYGVVQKPKGVKREIKSGLKNFFKSVLKKFITNTQNINFAESKLFFDPNSVRLNLG